MDQTERKRQVVEACKASINDKIAVISEDLNRLRDSANNSYDNEANNQWEGNEDEMMNDVGDLQGHLDYLVEAAGLFNRIDFGQRYETVEPGAVVITDQRNFLIGATNEFKCEGEDYIGIVASAPIYAEMKDRKAGDTFTMNQVTYTIKEIF
ncbi:hypothetical protein [Telluribacter sp. SYSU D00476]|uniref:hypothetical protein n=1 Tax=Telluribacter sp. SYSU D00476 TaxID=2811430 RepID=UPI001FF29D6A|nr:hypothetical protein [Telluribacter sp. SYSU D00476]